MTTETIVTCDANCGTHAYPGSPSMGRWGVLHTRTASGEVQRRDICGGCIAKMYGWSNPVVMGTAGARLLDLKRHPAGAGSA